MMLSPEIKGMLDLFKGDLASLSVYSFLCTVCDTSKLQTLSVKKIAAFCGIGRPRLIKILGKLKKLDLINFKTNEFGTELYIKGTTHIRYSPTPAPFGTTNIPFDTSLISNELPLSHNSTHFSGESLDKNLKSVDIKEKENLSFTGSPKFLEYGLPSPDVEVITHARDVQSDLDLIPSLSSKPETESGTGSGKTVLEIDTQWSSETPLAGKRESIQKKKSRQKAKVLKFTPEDLEIGTLWLDFAKREMSWTVPPRGWSEENFASELGKIRRITGINHEGLKALLHFVKNDNFWCQNALSPASLLKKSERNGLRKIDNILARMKPNSLRQKERMETWDTPLTDEELANPWSIRD